MLRKVIQHNLNLFSEIRKLIDSRKSFAYDPNLRSVMTSLAQDSSFRDTYLNEISTKDDILLLRIIDFAIDGLYPFIIKLDEYKECVKLMNSDALIKKQVNRSLSLLNSHQIMRYWTYVSHFIKNMVILYIDKLEIDYNGFNRYIIDLESFFYEEYVDFVDITPLHHFRLVGFSHEHKLVKIKSSIILSDRLRLVPITSKDKVRFWNKFPISHLDKPENEINYLLEYRFKVKKGFEVRGEVQELSVNTHDIFSTIVTLFRLVGVHCGIYDIATISKLDLPLYSTGINLFVSSLGVAYDIHPVVDLNTLGYFRQLWIEYGELLVKNVLNNQRFYGDPFTNLKISIIRFNGAFERKNGIDAFIDNIVSLEALYSKEDDGFRGVTTRLSRRLALFLETDPHKRKETFCEMVKLYDSRGKIIHGGHDGAFDIVKTRNYLTKSYLKYFEFLKQDNFSHAAFITSLDTEAKNFSMKRDDCKIKHVHNEEYNHFIPDFLFR